MSETAKEFQARPSSPYCGHAARIFDVAFSHLSSNVMASASEDQTARIWQRSNEDSRFQQVAVLRGHEDEVTRVNWAPGDSLLVTGSADSTARLWQPKQAETAGAPLEMQQVAVYKGGPKEEVYTCEFLEQGGAATQLVTSASRSLFLWDLASGKCIKSCLPPEFAQGEKEKDDTFRAGVIFGGKLRPGGGVLAVPCSDGAVRVWGVSGAGLQHLCTVKSHQMMATSLAFSPCGTYLASTGRSGDISVLDVRTLTCVAQSHAASVLHSCAALPSRKGTGGGFLLAGCGGDGLVRVFDLANPLGERGVLGPLGIGSDALLCLAASADGRVLAAAGSGFVETDTPSEPGHTAAPMDSDETGLFAPWEPASGAVKTKPKAVFGNMPEPSPDVQSHLNIHKEEKRWCPIHVWQR